MEVTLPLTGGCYCRRVRYEVRVQPLTLVACHCTICQTRTGSAFSMSMPVLRDGFVITEGATITRDLPGASGNLSTHHFCDHCLVRTHSEPHANRAVIYVRPGTLDDRRWLKPVAQLWTNDGRPWACIDGVLTFDGNPTDPMALVRAFKEWSGPG